MSEVSRHIFPDSKIILQRLKKATGISSDSELAKRLGYSNQSSLSNWKKRNKVEIDRILINFPDVDLNYLFDRDSQNVNSPEVSVNETSIDYKVSGPLSQAEILKYLEHIELLSQKIRDSLSRS